MKNKILISFFLFILMLSFVSIEQVFACMCIQSETCERYNFSDAIFIGKAISIEKDKSSKLEKESTIFEVKESFLGDNKKQIKVQNKWGFSCDVEFKKGETYLIFARGNQKEGFGTGFCNGNLSIEYATEEIANLRKLLKSDSDGKLFGVVLGELNQTNKSDERTPMPNVQLNIKELDSGENYKATSDSFGRYELAVKKGKYKVTLIPPKFTKDKFPDDDKIFEIKPRGCAEGYYVLANNSQIKGKVIDLDGNPVPNLRVELLTTSQIEKSFMRGESSHSDENGNFEFNDVPIGEYTLSVNFNDVPQTSTAFPTIFYPNSKTSNDAKIFEIKLGNSFENILFTLPPRLIEKRFEGNVYWADGNPAKDVEILLEDAEFPRIRAGCDLVMKVEKNPNSNVATASGSFIGLGCDQKTDSLGKFILSGFIGRKYKVHAEIAKEINGKKVEFIAESELFSIEEQPKSLNLVLKEKSKDK